MLNVMGSASQPMLGVLSSALGPFKPGPKPFTLPTSVPHQQPTPVAQIEGAINALHSKKKEWANLGCKERASLLRRCVDTTLKASEDAAKLMAQAKGSYGAGVGEERLGLVTPIYALREYAETLEAGCQPKPRKLYQRPDGQYVADVLPRGLEAMFFGGYKGEIWIQPGQQPTQAKVYRELAEGRVQDGAVSLVLGAGNQVSVLLQDILHMLVGVNAVVICKFNPVLDYLGPFAEQALAPLVEQGYVSFVYGGAEQGKFVSNHRLVTKIHLTGSAATYDAIVWGGKAKAGQPPLNKAITAELGCVTPYLVVPGKWSPRAIKYYADECVAGMMNNAGHNCTKLEILVTAKGWPQREAFIAAVRERLAELPRRFAWYPGSDKRSAAFKAKFRDAEELGTAVEGGETSAGFLPWTFKSGLTPDQADTETENWCGVLQEVALPDTGPDPASFLAAAVEFANNRCWGSLSCTVISSPDVGGGTLDRAVAALRYGSVAVNAPSFVGYTFPKLPWGAFRGNTPQDIGSGVGFVHNVQLYDNVEKSVLYSPWIHHPAHLWSPSALNLDATSFHALRFLAHPNLLTLTTTAFNALLG